MRKITKFFASRRDTLFCLSKIKYPNKKTPPAAYFLCFSPKRAAAELALSALRQSSPKTPASSAMLGAAAGEFRSTPCGCRHCGYSVSLSYTYSVFPAQAGIQATYMLSSALIGNYFKFQHLTLSLTLSHLGRGDKTVKVTCL